MLHITHALTPMKPTHSGSRDAPMPAEMHASTASVGLASCTILPSHPALRKASRISPRLGGPRLREEYQSVPGQLLHRDGVSTRLRSAAGITARSSYSATVRCRSQISGRTGDWQSPMSILRREAPRFGSLVRISLSLTRTFGGSAL